MEVSQPTKTGAYHETVLPSVKKAPMSIKSTPPPPPTSTTASLRNKNVNFSSNGEDEKKREKYLTAKYGAHQMALIRKRLKVEMWIFDRLQELFGHIKHSQLGLSFKTYSLDGLVESKRSRGKQPKQWRDTMFKTSYETFPN